jgi:hypothetical protein
MLLLLILLILYYGLNLFPPSLDNNIEPTVDVYNTVCIAIKYRIAY